MFLTIIFEKFTKKLKNVSENFVIIFHIQFVNKRPCTLIGGSLQYMVFKFHNVGTKIICF